MTRTGRPSEPRLTREATRARLETVAGPGRGLSARAAARLGVSEALVRSWLAHGITERSAEAHGLDDRCEAVEGECETT